MVSGVLVSSLVTVAMIVLFVTMSAVVVSAVVMMVMIMTAHEHDRDCMIMVIYRRFLVITKVFVRFKQDPRSKSAVAALWNDRFAKCGHLP